MLDKELLIDYDARQKHLVKGEFLFKEGQLPRNYYQVLTGSIKMNNFNDDGKEFIQGIFTNGESFGEPPLLGDLIYPANAQSLSKTTVWELPRDSFYRLLIDHPQQHIKISKTLAKRLHYKATMMAEISSHTPEHRLLKLLEYFKFTVDGKTENDKYKVELSRQQIADLTGLRVETVIRAFKSLEKQNRIEILDHKIFF